MSQTERIFHVDREIRGQGEFRKAWHPRPAPGGGIPCPASEERQFLTGQAVLVRHLFLTH